MYQVEEKSKDFSIGKHTSVKSRIKAFLSEEMHKKKGRHHRTSSCPVRSHLTRTDSIHHLDLPYLDPHLGMLESNDQSPTSVDKKIEFSSASNESDSSQEPLRKSCAECSNMVVGDQAEHDHFDEHQDKSFENRTFIQGDLDYTEYMLKHNVDTLASHPKEYLDALDIINVNKELLLRILQDPGSPLAHHFCNQQAMSAKRGIDKSETFPSSGSLRKRSSKPSRLKQMKKADCRAQGQNQVIVESCHNPSPASAKHPKKQGETRAVVKHFKNLKQKIKHVIREGRKERHRITMDAIIHKIPRGQKVDEEIDNQIKNSAICGEGKDIPTGSVHETDYSIPFLDKNELQMRHMRRASSLDESLKRYCQLYETSFGREANHQISDGLKMRVKEAGSPYTSVPKYLARIYSLPDMKSFLDYEESSDVCSSEGPANSVVDCNVSTRSSPDLPVGSEDQSQMDDHTESVIQEASVEIGATNYVREEELALTPISSKEENTQSSSDMRDCASLTGEGLSLSFFSLTLLHFIISNEVRSYIFPGYPS